MKNQLNLIKLYAILRLDKLLGSKGDQNMMLLPVTQEFRNTAGDVLGNSTGPASSTLVLGAIGSRQRADQIFYESINNMGCSIGPDPIKFLTSTKAFDM